MEKLTLVELDMLVTLIEEKQKATAAAPIRERAAWLGVFTKVFAAWSAKEDEGK